MTSSHLKTFDVVVIGGGAVGLAVAWHLARRGAGVALLERDELGRGASWLAAGMLAPVAEAEHGERALLELGLAAAAGWPAVAGELARASGRDPGFRRCGALLVARDADEAEALERDLAFRRGLGLEVERLRASQARALEPALAPTVRLALHAPGDHVVDPRALTPALALAAAGAGADLRPATAVAALCCRGERVTGVELEDGTTLAAGHVVVAAGCWSGGIAGIPAAARVPVRPVKGQILRLRDPEGPGLVERIVEAEGAYLAPYGDGRYALGGTVEERGFDTSVTAGGTHDLLRDAAELVPGILELELEEVAAGLRPGTPDNAPAIGPGLLEGLVWATGHHRNGILLAPITGELVADLIAGDGAMAALAAPFAPTRFAAEVAA